MPPEHGQHFVLAFGRETATTIVSPLLTSLHREDYVERRMTASASAHHQIFRVLIGPERGPLSLLCNDVDTPSHFIVGNVRVSSHHRSTKRRSVSRGKRKYKIGLTFFFSSLPIPSHCHQIPSFINIPRTFDHTKSRKLIST